MTAASPEGTEASGAFPCSQNGMGRVAGWPGAVSPRSQSQHLSPNNPKPSLKMLKQLGSDIPGAPAQASRVPSKVVVDQMSARRPARAGPQERPQCQRHPSLPAEPPQDHQLPAQTWPPLPPRPAGPYRGRQPPHAASRTFPLPPGSARQPLQEQPMPALSPHAISNNLELRGLFSLDIWKRGERNRKTHSNRRCLKLPPKVKNLKTWPLYKELLVLQASKREGSPGPKSSPARTNSPSK